jgi:hypothetical protein
MGVDSAADSEAYRGLCEAEPVRIGFDNRPRVVLNFAVLSPPKNRRSNSHYLSDIEGGGGPVSQCVGLSVIVSLSSPPAIN